MKRGINWLLAVIFTVLTAAGQTNNAEDVNRILNEYRSKGQSGESNTARLGQPTTFAVDGNYERFRNSPCYSKLGYNPNEPVSQREQRYSECEKEYYWGLGLRICIISLVIAIIIFIVKMGTKKKPRLN